MPRRQTGVPEGGFWLSRARSDAVLLGKERLAIFGASGRSAEVEMKLDLSVRLILDPRGNGKRKRAISGSEGAQGPLAQSGSQV